MNRKQPYPSQELLDSVEEIANIREKLSHGERKLTSAGGLYVFKHKTPGGVTQYIARGKFHIKLAFLRTADGSREIRKYQPGAWQRELDGILQFCRSLRASVRPAQWSSREVLPGSQQKRSTPIC
jgi:hypothetical protein